ncbi:hypothetical protein L1049_011105 [Liquidambar formosana]|uniref:Myb/SANT-like DNA-binding domain-containing protein n=1 Tax=Liquidambar formosana TaxID=63359 RepID=A0AAP0X2F0_LIQFO
MDRETNQENPSLLPNNDIKEESPRKPPGGGTGGGGGGGGGDRLKRDEWSEGAVSTLLEAYETKWILRNRAKLKGQDWEDVARFVSSRANCTKSPKTQTQCKNKIESMKKRYRSESASTADASSWPLYPRLDLLLRGSSAPPPPPPPPTNAPLILLEPPPVPLPQLPPPPPPQAVATPLTLGTAQNSHESNGVDRVAKEDGGGTKLSDHVSDKNAMETDSSTPALYSDKEKLKSKKVKTRMEKRKRRRREDWEVAESIRWLAEVVVRSEQARMDTMRELERMRADAEAKRGEMDLKRTEIIANTQLEIARLFAGIGGKGVDSSLRIGRS